jgi:hypothetical protein
VHNGVESGEDLESFGMKSKMTRGELLYIVSNISAAVLVKNHLSAMIQVLNHY